MSRKVLFVFTSTSDLLDGAKLGWHLSEAAYPYEKLANAKRIADVNADDHDAIYYVGGHCPVMDLASDPANAKVATEFYRKGKIIAAICHGPAGLLRVQGEDGKSIFSGRDVTCFSKYQGDFGGKYICAEPWKEKVPVSGNLITGQNPASAYPLARVLKENLGGNAGVTHEGHKSPGPLEKAKEKAKQVF